MITFDYTSLLSHFQTKAGMTPAGGGAAAPVKKAPAAPWASQATAPKPNERVAAALGSKPILDVDAARRKLSRGEEDYAELFALWNALDTLKALARRMDEKGVTALEKSQVQRRFDKGLSEVTAFVDKIDLDKLRLVRGTVGDAAQSAAGVRRDKPDYKTGVVHRGSATAPVASLQGDVRFSMTATTASGGPKTVAFDLAEMGSTTRTMANVADYLNGRLKDAGVITRFAAEALPQETRTIKTATGTVTLPDGVQQWRLKIAGSTTEALSFAAPDTADAIYVAQTLGKDDAQSRQLMKFQSDLAAAGAPAPAFRSAEPNWVEGRVFARGMDADVTAVRASATHTDGSVYMLAEIDGAVAGETIKGARDVALLKYDAAGNLVFSRTLGAASEANASAIAVSADGMVAIGGSVRGELGGADSVDTRNLDSFVTVYNGEGEELWTKRGVSAADDDVRALTFGADGTLYVAGQSKGAVYGESTVGGADSWLRAYTTTFTTSLTGVQTFKSADLQFTTQYGSSGDDAPASLSVDGSILVAAGVENGRAVVRRFDLQATGDPVQAASHDLGELFGGRIGAVSVSGGRITVAGSSANGALSAATTTAAHSGGQDVFVASFDDALTAGSSAVSYWGGVGADQVSAVAIKGTQVYVAGSSNADIGPLSKIGVKDGFVARLNALTGAQEWARRYTAAEGEVAPSAISIGAQQASVLDRLGLPSGVIDYTGSQLVTAGTSARAGDRFYIRTAGSSRAIPIIIEAQDTMKTLAAKITRALGSNGSASVGNEARSVDPENPNAGLATFERLKITPRRERTIEIQAGEGGRDLLQALGFDESLLRNVQRDANGKEIVPRSGKPFGLNLARDLLINSKEAVLRSAKELDGAMVAIQRVYRELSEPPAAAPRAGITGGKPTAYQLNQLANYQAGLARLTGGA